jgi:aspartate racemase
MKTIGLLGGMSWESSAQYYAIINREVMARLGHPHSARILMLSVDFGEVEKLQHAGEWDALGAMLSAEARKLEAGGADCILLCSNTMHLRADDIISAVPIPLIHIGNSTGKAICNAGIKRVGRAWHGVHHGKAFLSRPTSGRIRARSAHPRGRRSENGPPGDL